MSLPPAALSPLEIPKKTFMFNMDLRYSMGRRDPDIGGCPALRHSLCMTDATFSIGMA